jgi:hypothetical protein
MDSYIACQNEELRTSGDDASDQYLVRMTERITAARSEVDAVASDFNEQVQAFRAARQLPAGIR